MVSVSRLDSNFLEYRHLNDPYLCGRFDKVSWEPTCFWSTLAKCVTGKHTPCVVVALSQRIRLNQQTITSTQLQVAKLRFLHGVIALHDDKVAADENLFGWFDNVSWEPACLVSKTCQLRNCRISPHRFRVCV